MLFEEEIETSNTGEDTEAAPEPQETSEEKPAGDKPPQETKPKDTQDKETPFHLHPRWIERDNELKAERQARQQLENQMSDLQRQFQQRSQPAQPDKRAAMLERLKGIDPEFADFMSQVPAAKELEELREWKQQQAAEQSRQQVYSEIAKLHTQHSIPADLQARYQRDVVAAIRENPNAKLNDLPSIYKSVHEDYTKWMDGIKRTERESYVKAKKEAAAAPASQPKGKASTPSKTGTEWSKDPEEARAQIIKRTLANAKASSSI